MNILSKGRLLFVPGFSGSLLHSQLFPACLFAFRNRFSIGWRWRGCAWWFRRRM